MSLLRWTSISTAKLANEFVRRGFTIADGRICRVHYLNDEVTAFVSAKEPVSSIDTKKQALACELTNGGREYHPRG